VPLIFALCPGVPGTAELAERLIADPGHRPLRARFGQDAALHQVNCALDALSFLTPASVARAQVDTGLDPEGLAGLVGHLGYIGSNADD
jgi:hypothetical protein